MELRCERCSALTFGDSYCVSSEENGTIMLKMVVCHGCYVEARRVGLQARHIANPNFMEIQTLQ